MFSLFYSFILGICFIFSSISPCISPCISPRKILYFLAFLFFWGRGLSAISTPNKRCQIKGLPLVCTILSSSPRMALAHRFWKYGYMLPPKNFLTKISAYLGSLLHCPIGTSEPTRCPLILATAQGEPPFLRSLSATS